MTDMLAPSAEAEKLPTDDPTTILALEARDLLLAASQAEPGSPDEVAALEEANSRFSELVSETQEFLTKFALSRPHPRHFDVQEVVQETYARAYKGLHNFRGDAKFSTWLFYVLRSCTDNYWRRESRHENQPLPEEDDCDPSLVGSIAVMSSLDTGEVDDRLHYSSLAPQLEAMMDTLSPKQQQAIRMHDVMGQSTKYCAAQLGVTEISFKLNLHRARHNLRRDFPEARNWLEE